MSASVRRLIDVFNDPRWLLGHRFSAGPSIQEKTSSFSFLHFLLDENMKRLNDGGGEMNQ